MKGTSKRGVQSVSSWDLQYPLKFRVDDEPWRQLVNGRIELDQINYLDAELSIRIGWIRSMRLLGLVTLTGNKTLAFTLDSAWLKNLSRKKYTRILDSPIYINYGSTITLKDGFRSGRYMWRARLTGQLLWD